MQFLKMRRNVTLDVMDFETNYYATKSILIRFINCLIKTCVRSASKLFTTIDKQLLTDGFWRPTSKNSEEFCDLLLLFQVINICQIFNYIKSGGLF